MEIEEIFYPKTSKGKEFSRFRKVSTIDIDLSLVYLDKRHMGYQDNIVEEDYDRKNRKAKNQQGKYKEKSRN